MIGYFANRPSGCTWYRIKQPMEMLNRNGVKTLCIHLNEDVDDSSTAYQFYGAMPFSCEQVLKTLKADGKKIVYDMDDPLELIDTTNPFYYSVKKDQGSVNEILRYADHATVSTPAMAEYVKSKTSVPITVVPNCYTSEEWTYTRPDRGGIRIAFAGSATHVKDLIDIIPVIKSIQSKHKDLVFIIMGFGKSSYDQWYKEFRYSAPPEAIVMLEKLDKELSQIQFEWVNYVDYDKYPATLISMAIDIGICPLIETPFDRCRSACKAMEYTLAGALALASDTEPYRNDKNSVLVAPIEWEETIEYYITHPEERKERLNKHLQWTQEYRNINTQLDVLKSIYGV